MESPFFDKTSNNQSLLTQAQFNQDVAQSLATRDAFEARLRSMGGLEFVVAYDPLKMSVQIPTPDGGSDWSNVWVIKKQNRSKRQGFSDEVTILAYYYMVNDAIFMAPSIARVVGNRMLSTITSLDKMISAAAPLPLFSPARGHTYLPPTTKATAGNATSARASKESSPMPDAALSKAANASVNAAADSAAESADIANLRTLTEAFGLSLRYGKEYMDDTPLTGEPGSFIISKSKDDENLLLPPQRTQQPSTKSPFQATAASKEKSSSPLKLQTDISAEQVKRSSSKPASGNKSAAVTPTSTKDRKRRKSRPAETGA
ncbi:putative rna polymerase ii transcription mediator complex subunit [Phaeomoniella chlamydospora]|uniref:Mediator of RNA polymerase II transcription subunit 6 n=1 Tax=Phaeomoniella chlamydospora TaxID=158046 RepID=A0A0G2GFE0_PHACM|nr:putative rna polymerase ii transcription mediator complex subunit [Phaeomoniella chlamydospora]